MTFPSVVFLNGFQPNVVASFCLLTAATCRALFFMKNKTKTFQLKMEQKLRRTDGISQQI
jgi:hypothetical protein